MPIIIVPTTTKTAFSGDIIPINTKNDSTSSKSPTKNNDKPDIVANRVSSMLDLGVYPAKIPTNLYFHINIPTITNVIPDNNATIDIICLLLNSNLITKL